VQAIFFAILSYIGWGSGDLFATIAARKVGPYSATFWFIFLQLLITLPFGIFFLDDLNRITIRLVILTLSLAVLGNIGLITFYKGVQIGNAALVGSISASFIVLTVILSIVFLNESVTLSQTASMIIIFIGVIIASLDLKEIKLKKSVLNKAVIYGLVSMLTWGVYWTFIKIPVREINWFWPSIIASSSFPLVYLFMRIAKIELKSANHKNAFTPLLANSALISFGSLSYYYAISKGLIAVVAPIAGSYPTLFVLLAFLFFKDKITKQQIVGIVTTLVGIVLLSVFSV